DVQGEVIGIDAQFTEFEGGDQQVQRQLFVPEVVADDFGKERRGVAGQCQLDGSADVILVSGLRQHLAAVGREQLLVKENVVLFGQTVAQLFEVGAHQPMHAGIAPAREDAVKPGPIDQLGGGHLLQKKERVRLAGKVAAGSALPALCEV